MTGESLALWAVHSAGVAEDQLIWWPQAMVDAPKLRKASARKGRKGKAGQSSAIATAAAPAPAAMES